MILATPKGNRESFGAAFDSSTPIPRASVYNSHASRIDLSDAIGVPAFARGVRLICDTASSFPLRVYQGSSSDRVEQSDAPQAQLLKHPAGREIPSSQVWSYTFASMLRGGAYLFKVKDSRGNVIQLVPVDPRLVTPKYKNGKMKFDLRDKPSGRITSKVGAETILYVAGVLVEHPAIGVSVVDAFRRSISTEIQRHEFENRYLQNDGFPGVILKHASNVTRDQREELRESFESRHAGPSNAGRPAILWGGWEIDRVATTLTDAQFIESQKFGVQEVGRMLGIPAGLLNDPDALASPSVESENMRFLQYGLDPWITRLEQALANDVDIFSAPDWSVEFDPARLLRADIKTRFDAYRLARQGGWITANEIRAIEGYAPADGGDQIQETPVGGAPNTANSGSPAN